MPLVSPGVALTSAVAAGAHSIFPAEGGDAIQRLERLFDCALQAYLLGLGATLGWVGLELSPRIPLFWGEMCCRIYAFFFRGGDIRQKKRNSY